MNIHLPQSPYFMDAYDRLEEASEILAEEQTIYTSEQTRQALERIIVQIETLKAKIFELTYTYQ